MTLNIITIANQKGGVGKTTTACTLATALAARGHPTLLIDLDTQGHAAIALGAEPSDAASKWLTTNERLSSLTYHPRRNLALLAANKSLADAADQLRTHFNDAIPANYIERALKPMFRAGLHFTIIDAGPSLSNLQALALSSARTIIIPASCDYLAARAVTATLETIARAQQIGGNPNWRLLPTFHDRRTIESARILQRYRDLHANRCLTPIPATTAIKQAAARGKTILEYQPNHPAAHAYLRLVQSYELLNR